MATLNNNMRVAASAFAALMVTVIVSWVFVDATSLARVQRDNGSGGFLASVSALVR